MNFRYRPADISKDYAELLELWYQAGWREEYYDTGEELKAHIPSSSSVVAEERGGIAGIVTTMGGTFRHRSTDINLCAVLSVVTAIQFRGHAVGSILTRRALCRAIEEGAELSVLGAFDVGYYNKLGFGTVGCVHNFVFDPADIKCTQQAPPLHKLTKNDVAEMHTARLHRHLVHGACSITHPGYSTCIVNATAEHGVGLGIYDKGTLVAHLWGIVKDDINVRVEWWAANSPSHWIALLNGVATLKDQVQRVEILYPPYICIEDLLNRPCRRIRGTPSTERAPYSPLEYWQIRVLSVPSCIAKISLPLERQRRFNLRVHGESIQLNPHDKDAVSDYTVTLGARSECEPGHAAGLPLLECGIGAFSRLWCGAYSATTLALTDHLLAPRELLTTLDTCFLLPTPNCDWYI